MVLAVDWLVLGLRAASFVAIFQAAGAAIFLLLFERSLGEPVAERIRSAARAVTVAALILTVLHYVLTPARMAGSFAATFDSSLGELLLESTAGTASIVRVVGLALLMLSLDRASRASSIGAGVGAALTLGSFALMGHTVIHPLRVVLAPLLLVHVGVAAFWFGALWPLWLLVRAERAEQAATVVTGFSAYATRLVPLLFVGGVLLAVLFIRSFAELATPYGAMVLGKAVGFAAVLGLAALNKWRYAPRLAAGDSAAAIALAKTAVAEWALLAVVLAATAVMTSLYAPEHLEGAFGPGHAEPEHAAER